MDLVGWPWGPTIIPPAASIALFVWPGAVFKVRKRAAVVRRAHCLDKSPQSVMFFEQSTLKRRGGDVMADHYITEDCINCGACADVCPVEAISEKGEVHVIDPEVCTDCGACNEVCPVDAIKWE
jgi:ferredoxin